MRKLVLTPVEGAFAVCRLGPSERVPDWAGAGSFCSITRTSEELSIVCDEAGVPAGARREGGWKALKLEGPFDLSETGVIASIAAPLAEAGIGIFVISTYDTDYLLVKNDDLESAGRVLARDGHTVRPGS